MGIWVRKACVCVLLLMGVSWVSGLGVPMCACVFCYGWVCLGWGVMLCVCSATDG